MQFLIIVVVNLLIGLILYAKGKHITRPLQLIVQSIVLLSTTLYLLHNANWINYVVIALNVFIFGGLAYLIRNSMVRFDDFRIYNIQYIMDKIKNGKSKGELNHYRAIGKVVPQEKREIGYNDKIVSQDKDAFSRHTLISGKNGSGKTYLIASLVRQDIASSRNIIYADYKGDSKIMDQLLTYATKHGYKIFTLFDGVSDFNYDPLRNINNAARTESLINTHRWENTFFREQTLLFINKTLPLYSRVYDAEDKSNGVNFAQGYFNFLTKYNRTRSDDTGFDGLRDILNSLITSSIKHMFGNKYSKTLDFQELIDKNEKYMIAIGFHNNLRELATTFSAMLYSDVLALYQNAPVNDNIALYCDEVSALTNISITDDILTRGRSAHIGATLAFQSLNQVSYKESEFYLDTMLENVNSLIAFPGLSRTMAEKISSLSWTDEVFNLQTLKKYGEKGISPTIYYKSDFSGLPGDKKRIHILQPFIFDEESLKDEITAYVENLTTNPGKETKPKTLVVNDNIEVEDDQNEENSQEQPVYNVDSNGQLYVDKMDDDIVEQNWDDLL